MKYTIIILSFVCTYSLAQEYKIVYTEQVNNNDNIVLNDLNGNQEFLTTSRSKDSSPVISPDGKWMVMTSERVGWWKIWLMNLEDNSIKQLTNASNAEYSPSWSPDGNKIVFVSSRDGNQEIYVMDKDGQNQQNITRSKGSDIMPSWANDGFIYYSTEIENTYQLARINPDGSNMKILTIGSINILMPSLSNDKSKVLFYGDFDDNFEVALLDLKSKRITQLTNNPLMDMRPKWSSDNKKIVFERGNKGNNHHIYIMNTDGTDVRKITNAHYNYSPSFIP